MGAWWGSERAAQAARGRVHKADDVRVKFSPSLAKCVPSALTPAQPGTLRRVARHTPDANATNCASPSGTAMGQMAQRRRVCPKVLGQMTQAGGGEGDVGALPFKRRVAP